MGTSLRDIVTQKVVKELFHYFEGDLIRIKSAPNCGSGEVAGTLSSDGYRQVKVKGLLVNTHRLIFLWHHGYIPENDIDHIDRNRSNNRIENLREVTRACNVKNSGMLTSNKSGIKGVSWNCRDEKWMSCIMINGVNKGLGFFSDITEAVAHRLAAEQCLDWNLCDSRSSAFNYINKYTNR